jgi:phospholipid/cholesterol/gamma-HCH transport system substrate-binding protein
MRLERLSVNQQALVGLVALALTAVLGTIGLKAAFGHYEPGYDLTATFDGSGQNLDSESPVKMRGVDVGWVDGVDLTDDNRAVVTLRLDPGTEVPTTATAVIRPISVFGPKYVDLVPGAGEGEGPFYAEGDEIERTRSSLELGDIIGEAADLLEAVDPQDLTTMLHTFAEGVDGLETEMAEGIDDSAVALDSAVDSTEDRRALISGLALLAQELADRGETMVATGDNVHRSLPALTERGDDFAGLLEATSRLSSDLAAVLDANRGSLGPAAEAGAVLSDVTADDLRGMVAYLDFVRTYGDVLSQVIRIPVAGESFLMATQQFLMSSNPCTTLVQLEGCQAPSLDPEGMGP